MNTFAKHLTVFYFITEFQSFALYLVPPCSKGLILNIVGVHNINPAWCEATALPHTELRAACPDLTPVGKT